MCRASALSDASPTRRAFWKSPPQSPFASLPGVWHCFSLGWEAANPAPSTEQLLHRSPLPNTTRFGTLSRAQGCCSGTTLILQTRGNKTGSTRLCSCTPGIAPAAFHAPAGFRWSSRAHAAPPEAQGKVLPQNPATAKPFSFQPAPRHRLSSKLSVGIAAGNRPGPERRKPPRIRPVWPCPAALSSPLPPLQHRHRSARSKVRETKQETSKSPTCSRPDEEEGET